MSGFKQLTRIKEQRYFSGLVLRKRGIGYGDSWCHAEAIFVELDGEPAHRLHSTVSECKVHVWLTLPS